MTNILKHTGGNIGGLLPVRYALASDIDAISTDPRTLAATIVMKVEPGWRILYATPDTIKVESEEEDTPAGMKYTYLVKMMIPKDRSDVELALRDLNNQGVVIIAHDKNGVARLYGTKENPMRKISKLSKPENVEGFNGWELTFQGVFGDPAAYYPTAYIWEASQLDPGGGGGTE